MCRSSSCQTSLFINLLLSTILVFFLFCFYTINVYRAFNIIQNTGMGDKLLSTTTLRKFIGRRLAGFFIVCIMFLYLLLLSIINQMTQQQAEK